VSAIVRQLGRVGYEPAWRAMQAFTDVRGEATPDELWFLEHDPVFTQGLNGRAEHVLAPGDIPVIGNVNLGHAGPNLPLPLGVRAAMDADALTLELLEGAVG